jgi:hypothetical protein
MSYASISRLHQPAVVPHSTPRVASAQPSFANAAAAAGSAASAATAAQRLAAGAAGGGAAAAAAAGSAGTVNSDAPPRVCMRCGRRNHVTSACNVPQCTDPKCKRFGHTRDDHKDSCYQCGSLKHKADACTELRCRQCQLWGHEKGSCPFVWMEAAAKRESQRTVRGAAAEVEGG